eukprot:TRINITY_DN3300_c0_g2_i1.p1 TRINITY_DN3300_c0_g2~~TRINITY_DN3300_c0_g2_i1.p1  ORF type:complete len:417 (+),score=92.26 TRINITY_DN3300_c0_g2_i1:47-1297(+)
MRLLLLLALVFFAVQARKDYTGHVVFRLQAPEDIQIRALEFLKADPEHYDFWTPISPSRFIDLRVHPSKIAEIQDMFSQLGIEYDIMIENLQDIIETERRTLKAPSDFMADDYYQHYHTYDENIQWLKTLAATYPNMTKLINIGSSYQGRDLLALKVFAPGSTTQKRALWIDGGIHAREWITTATLNYILGHLISDYSNDTAVKTILDNADVYVLPMFNPDGYVYSWTDDRMWRKTRSPNKGSVCVGTDANRNWDWHWDGSGSSTNPCADDYRGSAPFSEVETKTVSNYLASIPKLVGYINFHSYSQLWMYPWGYTYLATSDKTTLDECAKVSVQALTAVYGTKYTYGQISTTIYIASGNTCDWTYGQIGVTYSMAVELRDTGKYGFLLPENQIVPSGIETFAGFKAYAQYVIKHT